MSHSSQAPQAPSGVGTSEPVVAQVGPVDPRTELTLNEQVGHYVEMWKKSVDVQQHFNDIEWRIRGLALTVATFALGAAGVTAKDGSRVGWFSLGSLVVLVGLILWYAFYFVDRVWYHPLLKAAVEQGMVIEKEIKKSLPQAGMTTIITARSPQQVGRVVRFISRKPSMHSDDKLVWFYQVGAAAFVVAAIVLQIGALLANRDQRTPQPMERTPSTVTTRTPQPPSSSPAPGITRD